MGIKERAKIMSEFLHKIEPYIDAADVHLRLEGMGYLNSPASTCYHGNYDGGLFDHSCEVARVLNGLTEKLHLTWNRPESPWIVGMFHDLCKVDAYELRIPDPPEYGHANTTLKGHGEKSVMIASTLLQLTEEEVYCIRFHMGAFNTDEINEYGRAVEKYPNVLWTHTADMVASKIYGI